MSPLPPPAPGLIPAEAAVAREPAAPAAAPAAPPSSLARLRRSFEASERYPTWVLLAALAGMFATTFPVTILTLSLESIATEFRTTPTAIAWVISGPMLLSAVALPLLGKLGDLRGHRRMFLLGFAGATIVAALTALAWSPASLIGFRTLAAVLGGATQPTSMALIFSVYPQEERVRAMGWWSMTGAAAPALGLVAGGPLVDWFGWRIVFVFQALLSAVALALAAVVLKETPRQNVRFDIAGSLTLAFGVAGVMWVLARLQDLGIGSPWILGGALCGVAGIAAFIAVERRAAEPLIPLAFFQRRNFTAPILSNALMSASYMGAFVVAPFVLFQIFGFSITAGAAFMLLRTLSLTFSSPAGGWLGEWLGQRHAAMIGCAVLAIGSGLVASAIELHTLAGLGAAFILQGLGHGLGLPSLTASISSSVPQEDLGIASAANRLTAQLGSAAGITLLTLVYAHEGGVSGLSHAFMAAAVLSALAFASAFVMQRDRGTLHARRV